MRDPVLDRDLFRSTRKDVEEGGIAAIPEAEDEGYVSRVEEAKRLLEKARSKQDPTRFQTLSEQSKPGVFRPIQAGGTQMPQPNVQQQMAQMQAMGFRPVGMAKGGEVTPTIAPPGDKDPSTWTDEDIAALAQERLATDPAFRKLQEEYPAATPLGRGIQAINPFSSSPLDTLISELEAERAYSTSNKVRSDYNELRANRQKMDELGVESVLKAQEENPVPSILSEVTEEEYRTAKEKQRKALEEEETAGIKTLQPTKPAPAVDTAEMEREARRGVGLSTRPSGIEALDETEARREFLRGKALSDMETQAAPAAPVSPKEEADKSNVFNAYSTNLEKIKADRAAQRQENINLAMIQAGLAIAGGTSSNALANIAQGGISGIQAFGQAEKESRADFRQAQQDLRSEQERARDEAFRRESLGLQQRAQKFKEEVEFPKTLEAKAAERTAPSEEMKLYAAIGGGDIRKGLELVEASSITNSKVNAYKAILQDPMAPEEDKVEARNALMALFAPPTSDTSGFTLRGVR